MQPASVIQYSSQLTDASLAAIGETCKGLTIIDMSGNKNMTDVGIASLTEGCGKLKHISLTSSQLTDASLAVIGETCKGLTSIDMSRNRNITDDGIVSLTEGCRQLETINTSYCSELTDASLAAIGETCRGLTSIDISSINKTDVGIASLTQGCSQLQSINNYKYITSLSTVVIIETWRAFISGNNIMTDFGTASLTHGGCVSESNKYKCHAVHCTGFSRSYIIAVNSK